MYNVFKRYDAHKYVKLDAWNISGGMNSSFNQIYNQENVNITFMIIYVNHLIDTNLQYTYYTVLGHNKYPFI